VLFELLEETVFVVLSQTVSEAKTHVAISICREKRFGCKDSKDVEIEETDRRVWTVLDAGGQLVEGSLDLGVKRMKFEEVSDFVNFASDILSASRARRCPFLGSHSSAVFTLRSHDSHFTEHRVRH